MQRGDFGEMSVPVWRVAFAAAAAVWLVAAPALAQDASREAGLSPIGNAIQIIREVTGEIEARFRYLLREDPVFANEVIETQPESASRIIFQDRTELSVGPGARITLDEFVFDPDPSLARFILSAFDGVFRFKSGNLAKTAYAIETPTAVIGVRGTVFASVFGPDGQNAIVLESSASSVTIRPIGACDTGGAESVLSGRGSAIVIDGCDVSNPGPPPQWAIERIAELNYLLAELHRKFGHFAPLDNDPPEPQQQEAAEEPPSPPPAPVTTVAAPPPMMMAPGD